ncbi:hypothetical protein E1189_01765, partial [Sansalvadorimonas verongulae]|nr:hypothetical protein [Sansalvadorimonas verongulae]
MILRTRRWDLNSLISSLLIAIPTTLSFLDGFGEWKMLRTGEKTLWACTSFFLLILGLCEHSQAMYQCTIERSQTLVRKYKEHDFLAACREGNVEAVQIFLDQEGFDVNENFESGVSGRPVHGLYLAAQEGHAEVVKMLVNTEGVDVNQ